jgi:hypothetical protein
MDNHEIRNRVENCPKRSGYVDHEDYSHSHRTKSNTRVDHRIIFEFCSGAPPPRDLAEKERGLDNQRLPDVRFLILVLTGLRKVNDSCHRFSSSRAVEFQREISNSSPKLIQLSSPVAREVFSWVLGAERSSGEECELKTIFSGTVCLSFGPSICLPLCS